MRSLAIETSKAGFRVIPLRPGTKKPAIHNWQNAPLDFLDVVETWEWGDDHGVGIVTGRGFFVLDVDVKGGQPGTQSLTKMTAKHGPLPATRTVRTASGGWHYYFETPPGRTVSNANKTLKSLFGDGLDIRGEGGQVVAPGNVYEGKAYTLDCSEPIATAPTWLLECLAEAPVKSENAGMILGETDIPADISRARDWLAKAPETLEGSRDNTAYQMACRFYDFGTSQTVCLELLSEWNETKCLPPLEDSDLERIAASALKSRQEAVGCDSHESLTSCFSAITPVASVRAATAMPQRVPFRDRVVTLDLTEDKIAALPPREWIAERRLLRGKVTSLVAPGATGKSLLTLQWAAALALGDGRWTALDVREQCRVLVINNEDETDEMERRLLGATIKFGLPLESINGELHLHGAEKDPFVAVSRLGDKSLSPTSDTTALIEYIIANKIGAVVVDPLVETHEANENDNGEMARVMSTWKRVASTTRAAILLVHHTRKPPQASGESFAGSMDAGRGASAVVNSARIGVTLFNLDAELARKLRVPEDERGHYVRLDDAKANLFRTSHEAQLFRRVSVPLPNGETVGVLEPADLGPSAELRELTSKVLAVIREREAHDDLLPTTDRGDKGAAFIISRETGVDRKQVQAAISELARTGAIKQRERSDNRNRKTNVWVTAADEDGAQD